MLQAAVVASQCQSMMCASGMHPMRQAHLHHLQWAADAFSTQPAITSTERAVAVSALAR